MSRGVEESKGTVNSSWVTVWKNTIDVVTLVVSVVIDTVISQSPATFK